jgi:hypothetical protein
LPPPAPPSSAAPPSVAPATAPIPVLASPFDEGHPAGCRLDVAPTFTAPLRLRLAPDAPPFADVTAAPAKLSFPNEGSSLAPFAEVAAPSFRLRRFVSPSDFPTRHPRWRIVVEGVLVPSASLRFVAAESDGMRVEVAPPPWLLPRHGPLVAHVRCEDVGIFVDEASFTLDEEAPAATSAWGLLRPGPVPLLPLNSSDAGSLRSAGARARRTRALRGVGRPHFSWSSSARNSAAELFGASAP